MLVSPDDLTNYRKIIKSLNRGNICFIMIDASTASLFFFTDADLPVFPVESDFVASLKPRLKLALAIDSEEHRSVGYKFLIFFLFPF